MTTLHGFPCKGFWNRALTTHPFRGSATRAGVTPALPTSATLAISCEGQCPTRTTSFVLKHVGIDERDYWTMDCPISPPHPSDARSERLSRHCALTTSPWQGVLLNGVVLAHQSDNPSSSAQIGRAVQQECRDRSRMPSSA
eukprot:TRINITY_DN59182_c0_g1_i2.p1 TRINITY_DN59182_c0_g1~~TRINITY_DN59182_c0_g1_i2.p1  ORF type:complete len:141 (+),score=3.21 TRINITY_DN59182_c0_g1_i2:541-963(+)